ncbi:glycosyl transferase family 2 [Sphingomonas aurantiaca]|uniref:Glycosyl transferase family 2 n=1 Tax=Sphingomonas aurantiaca TaxID=185949 RepID=A0A2T5GGA4_9SPHN|nr:glycosyltransferase [Sphingomonas aurantiaca]PTQ58333.1 glycosyl transferase family 2 [Sphingomonas aurantiaca]
MVGHRPNPVVGHPLNKPFLLYGVLCFVVGMAMYVTGVLLVFPRYLLNLHALLDPVAEWLVWYSGVPIMIGIVLALFDLLYMLQHKKPDVPVRYIPVQRRRVTVALTAYNDEDSIAGAVEDFLAHPLVERVIVVSNNSRDATFARAEAAGALTFNEPAPGYGRCVHRCLSEAVRFDDTEFVVLCEGDSTFRAYDVEKLLAYAPHADIVNGSRIVEPLRQYLTQLTVFMYYGNLFVGKLLEAKYLGRGTITDVGTTYKLCRRDALVGLLPHLNPGVNLEFNAHFLDTALSRGLLLLECPITFHARIGLSKGGNINNWRGFTVGARMIYGLLSDWKRYA